MTSLDIYARVSRASDDRMRSEDGQVYDCRRVAEEVGHEVDQVHIDPSKSAWNPKVYRPAWEALMRRLESGDTGGVVIFDLARFTRRPAEGERLIAAAERGLTILDSESEYDLTTANGKKAFRSQMANAAYESDRLSTRVMRGKRMKARERGEPNASTRAFGFQQGNVIAHPAEAAELRRAAKALLSGVDQATICADLNRRGVLTVRGHLWTPGTLRMALTRPLNVGDVVYRDEKRERHVRAGVNPGIMEREVYERVAALYAGRKRGRPVSNLATGFARCECGHALNGADEAHRSTPYPDGSRARVYKCIRSIGGCGSRIDWLDLNGRVHDLALTILSDPAHASAIEKASRTAADELTGVQARVAELDTLATALAARLGSGQMSLERYDAAVTPMDAQLEKLRAQEKALVLSLPHRAADRKRESRATWERRWATADLNGQREIVRRAFGGRALIVSRGGRFDPARDRCRFTVELGG